MCDSRCGSAAGCATHAAAPPLVRALPNVAEADLALKAELAVNAEGVD
jgi:hypothetical protein